MGITISLTFSSFKHYQKPPKVAFETKHLRDGWRKGQATPREPSGWTQLSESDRSGGGIQRTFAV